jgi:hypothetical protein
MHRVCRLDKAKQVLLVVGELGSGHKNLPSLSVHLYQLILKVSDHSADDQ